MNLDKLGVWYFFDGMSAQDAAASAARIEEMGFSALWIPETLGRHPFVHAGWLLGKTEKLVIATGIANIYHREPGVTVAGQKSLAEQSDGRFLLGLGVSHKPLVEGVRGLKYGPPVKTMSGYLESMRQAPYTAFGHDLTPPTVIAALGPKMLELARDHADGAHPYFSTPSHTKMARGILGPDKWLCVEQKVLLETDPDKARKLARQVAQTYIGLPNYRNNWLRSGFTEADLADGGSDRFIDETFAWGSVADIRARIQAHVDAGASHVCVQPVNRQGQFAVPDWDLLAQLAPG